MKNNPKISVLMPVYNGEKYLKESIESVLEQTFTDFEFIIINDGSTDSSVDIIKKYQQDDSRILLLNNQKEKGIVGALNTGLEAVKGKYIARMDSDDINLPYRFEKQASFLDSHSDVVVCGTWVELIGTHSGKIWRLAEDHDVIKCTMLFCGSITHPTVMIRSNFFVDNRIFYDNDYLFAEDYELWTRIIDKGKFANIPEILLNYRTHNENIGTVHNFKQVENSRRVRINQIMKLGIKPSEDEIEMHQKLSNYQYGADSSFLKKAEKWLDRIEKANNVSKIYPRATLANIISKKRSEMRCELLRYQQGKTVMGRLRASMIILLEVIRKFLKIILPIKLQNFLANKLAELSLYYQDILIKTEKIRVRLGFCTKLAKNIKKDFKIGMAVLSHERPEYLKLCLDSLFKTNLYNYDITFLINDDGSKDPQVQEIINQEHDPKYKIFRYFTPKGPNCAGAAINKAVHNLLEVDDFDVIGWCDPDAVFHPEWLNKTMKICLWAKENHKDNVLGPFSSFNSSDYKFHKILGTYKSPFGNYVVKRQMGMLNYFYFKEDFVKLGYFEENSADETMMTDRFEKLGVRNFCTETSYIEHIGQKSVLNQWRPVPIKRAVHGMNLAKGDWGMDMKKVSPYGYYRYLKNNQCFCPGGEIKSEKAVDVVIPVIRKDLATVPLTVKSVRKYLKHPIGNIYIIGPDDEAIKDFCEKNKCVFKDEDSVLPIKLSDLKIKAGGLNRSGWIFQQLLKLNSDTISDKPYIYVIDADTILLKPQKFEHMGKSLLLFSGQYHEPYYENYKRLFGEEITAPLSFVCHQMLFEKEKLEEIKKSIEEKNEGKSWFKAIIDSLNLEEASSFSEYETYGNWMFKNYPNEIILEYCFNKSLPRKLLKTINLDSNKYAIDHRSASFHAYKSNLAEELHEEDE